MRSTRPPLHPLALAAILAVAWAGCARLEGCRGDDVTEEAEERDRDRLHYWRMGLELRGAGAVRTSDRRIDCRSDGARQIGACGPVLLTFTELEPPLLVAQPAPGWAFDHWTSRIRDRDGTTRAHAVAEPGSVRYLNAFGYADTGQEETVTAVFVRAPPRPPAARATDMEMP